VSRVYLQRPRFVELPYCCPMANPAKVVVDGFDTPDSKPRAWPYWSWLAAGLLIGFGTAFLLFATVPMPQTGMEEEPADRVPRAEPAEGVGSVIAGFRDDLVAATSSDGQAIRATIWPVASPSYERELPLSTNRIPVPVEFDLSGTMVAALSPVPGERFSALYAGSAGSVRLVDLAVTGHSWHDSLSGLLAYTTEADGITNLWRLEGDGALRLVAELETELGGLSAWGKWGFALQDLDDERVILLSPGGEITREIRGRVLASRGHTPVSESGENGLLIIEDGGLSLHTVVGGSYEFGGRFSVVGDVIAGAFSPDDQMLAVMGHLGILVTRLDSDEPVAWIEPSQPLPSIVWSSDSRFLLIPSLHGLTVLDVSSNRVDLLMEDRTFHGVAVMPTSG